jgi:hypothetical protein
MTIPRTLGLFASFALLGACTTGPLNGTPYAGASTTGASFTFEGYSNQANQLISLQVLTSPTADPSKDTNWAQFATTRTSTNPIVVAGDTANPLYSWETTAVPANNGFAGWPVGGVLRTRAISYDNNTNATHQLLTFDEPTFNQCFGAAWAAGETWTQIGQDCAGLGNSVVSLVSTAKNPLTLPTSLQPDWLGYKGDITPQETETYYGSWNAPKTLASFKSTYGFTSSDPTATYYNDNDLGIGREMHCHKITTGAGGVACYVANYSASAGIGSFGDNPQTVLDHAIAHTGAFATVAMVYTPPANTPNSVKFVVYDASGARTDTAKLDTVGKHVSIPNNCLNCHGIDAQFISGQVNGNAKFLPFDPQQYVYSTTNSSYSLNSQQEAFRKLNVLISQTSPTTAETDFLDGIYSDSGGLNTAGAFANDTYIPSGWKSANGQAMQSTYLGIVKVGCRMCHVSATNPGLDWLSSDDWTPAYVDTIRKYLCQPASAASSAKHPMPQAQRTTQKLWDSGARGLLITGWPYEQQSGSSQTDDGFEACTP